MLTYHKINKTESARAVERETEGEGENTYICLFQNEFFCFKDDWEPIYLAGAVATLRCMQEALTI